jgi:hypothetical protein
LTFRFGSSVFFGLGFAPTDEGPSNFQEFYIGPIRQGQRQIPFPQRVRPPFLDADAESAWDWRYGLFGFLLHGDQFPVQGHYDVFLQPEGRRTWYRFNDSRATEAVAANYGGRSALDSASLLVSVRVDDILMIFCELDNSAVPPSVVECTSAARDAERKEIAAQVDRRMIVHGTLINSDILQDNATRNCLIVSVPQGVTSSIQFRRDDTITQLYSRVAEQLDQPIDAFFCIRSSTMLFEHR